MKNLLLKKVLAMTRFVFFGVVLQLIFISLLMASTVGNAQRKSMSEIFISITADEATLEEVFSKIEQSSGLRFAYNHENLSHESKINLQVKNKSLAKILESISKQAKLKFKRINENIHVSKLKNSDIKAIEEVISTIQTRNITGKVTSYEDDEGLPGVNVIEKGTNNGTVTNVQGVYSLEVSEGATLVFSSVGYTTEEIEIGNRSVIDLVMTPDIQQLQELVVVGYGTQRRSDLTGALSSVEPEDFNQIATANVADALKGKVAGVHIQSSDGQPGVNPRIFIRGISSLTGASEPLYVLDGVPLNGSPLGNLSPADIESIEVLKDASATAIYGSRAANGVVIITSSSSKRQEGLGVEFNTYYGYQELAQSKDGLSGREWAQLHNTGIDNYASLINSGDINVNDPAAEIAAWEARKITDLDNQQYYDNESALFRDKAAIAYTSLNLYKNTEDVNLNFGVNYINQEGLWVENDYERINFRLGLDANINNRLRVRSNVLYSNGVRTQPPTGSAGPWTYGPLVPVQNEDGSPFIDPGAIPDYLGQTIIQPAYSNQFLSERDITQQQLIANVNAEVKIFDWLKYNAVFGGQLTANDNEQFYNSEALSRTSSIQLNYNDNRLLTHQSILTFNKSFDIHDLTVTGVFEAQDFRSEGIFMESNNVPQDVTSYNAIEAGSVIAATTGNVVEWGLLSWLGRVNYVLNDKYLFTASFRTDGSSRFQGENKWGYFPSAAVAWRLGNEDFIQNAGVFSDLKLRASWGVTGNQAISPYSTLSTIVPYQVFFGPNPVNVYAPTRLPAPGLKWEDNISMNVGLDMGFFDNRLNATFEFYRRNTSDQLAVVQIPPSTGFGSITTNVGEIQNSGIEITIDAVPIARDFTWNIGAQVSINKNKIVELADGVDIPGGRISNFVPSANIAREGEEFGAFWVFEKEGYNQIGQEIIVNQNGDTTASGSPLINVDDRIIAGSPWPDFTFGLTNNFSYKNFDLSIFLQGNVGQDVYPFFAQDFYSWTRAWTRGHNVPADYIENMATLSEDNSGAKYPLAITPNRGEWNGVEDDDDIEDASFMRIRNIRLTYHLPLEQLNINWMQSLSVFANVDNLYTFTNYSGYDPEANSQQSGSSISNFLRVGIDARQYPLPRAYTFGLQVGF